MRAKRIQGALRRLRTNAGCGSRRRGTQLEVAAVQQDLLREAAVAVLGDVDAVAAAIRHGDWRTARHLRWRHECLFRLLDDLGWSPDNGSDLTALTISPQELETAVSEITSYVGEMIAVHRAEPAVDVDGGELERLYATRAARRALRRQVLGRQARVAAVGW